MKTAAIKRYEEFRKEADETMLHLSASEKDAWVKHLIKTHPGFHRHASPEHHRRFNSRAALIIIFAIVALLLFLFTPRGKADPAPYRFHYTHTEMGEMFPQLVTPISVFKFDASGNLDVNCIAGCVAGGSFTDNTAFTVGATTITNIGAYFTSGADPACTTGNACRLRADAASNLRVNCIVGCAGGSTTPADTFANPSTAGLQFDLLAGWNGATWDRLRSSIANGLAVDVTRVQGTVGVTQSTSPWVENLTQVASTVLGTPQAFGTAPTGVVVGTSSDLYLAGTRARSNQTTTAGGVVDVNIVGSLGVTNSATNGTFTRLTDNTTGVGVIAGTTALKTDMSSVAGTATVTGAAGVQAVAIRGNTNVAIDAANNAAAPANVIVNGFEAQSSALGTSATAANVRRGIVGLDGVLYVRQGGPLLWSCGLTAIAATLTQCQAAPAAATSLYLSNITIISDTATAGQYLLRFGTGANCGTGTTTLFPNVASLTTGKLPYPANNSTNPAYVSFSIPLKITAANALCVICVATNTCTISMQGYTAP